MHNSGFCLFLIVLLLMSTAVFAQDVVNPPDGHSATAPVLSGVAALNEAVNKGLIKKADLEDVRQYLLARAKAEGLPENVGREHLDASKWYPLDLTYVVLSSDFVIPPGLQRNFSFIVPRGQPEPKGPHGLSRIYSYDQLKSEQPIAEACVFPNLGRTPAEARVFAFGAESFNGAARVNVQIDPSTTQSYLIKITVNSPSKPAIVILQARDATIWHFNWTKGTKIEAVYINGQYKQVVSGLPDNVQVYINDQKDDFSACPPINISSDLSDLVLINDLSNHLFKKDVSELHQIKKGQTQAVAGSPLAKNSRLESAEELDLEKFRMPPNPLLGQAGLREALAQGLIRKATEEDIYRYTRARARAEGLSEGVISNLGNDPLYLGGGYVVLSPDFVIPDGLYDGYKQADYIVPDGIPEPKGPRRDAKIYSYDQLKSNKAKQPIAETCKIAGLPAGLAPSGKVYAVSGNLDAMLDFQIEGSPYPARLMKVKANSPTEPVFLLLKANGPTIWHFSWTKGTKIAGVFISSQQRQIVSGLPEEVPVLISNLEDNPSQCPELKLSWFFNYLVADNDLSRHLF